MEETKKKPVWITEDDYLALPENIVIREFIVAGIVYVTTLLDDKIYHKKRTFKFIQRKMENRAGFSQYQDKHENGDVALQNSKYGEKRNSHSFSIL